MHNPHPYHHKPHRLKKWCGVLATRYGVWQDNSQKAQQQGVVLEVSLIIQRMMWIWFFNIFQLIVMQHDSGCVQFFSSDFIRDIVAESIVFSGSQLYHGVCLPYDCKSSTGNLQLLRKGKSRTNITETLSPLVFVQNMCDLCITLCILVSLLGSWSTGQ